MTKRSPNPIDVYVGSRVRLRRMMMGMSQETLGEHLGITFQQVQKYEKGTNRIGASRLHNISILLKVPVSFFFEGAPNINNNNDENGKELSETASANYVVDFIGSNEGLQLNRAFVKIKDAQIRRNIVDLVRNLSKIHNQENPPSA